MRATNTARVHDAVPPPFLRGKKAVPMSWKVARMRYGWLAMRCVEDTWILGKGITGNERFSDIAGGNLIALTKRCLVRGDRFAVARDPQNDGFVVVPEDRTDGPRTGQCVIRFLEDPWLTDWRPRRQAELFADNLNAWCDVFDRLTLQPHYLADGLVREPTALLMLARRIAEPRAPLMSTWDGDVEGTFHVGIAANATLLSPPGPGPLLTVRGEPAAQCCQALLEHLAQTAIGTLQQTLPIEAVAPHLKRLAIAAQDPRAGRQAIKLAQQAISAHLGLPPTHERVFA